ncbi:hypothetical protein NM10_12902 [Megasphaera sp. NM10]|nr:hypothetical protein NM10_12902 [Megasphaera sp. NM10]
MILIRILKRFQYAMISQLTIKKSMCFCLRVVRKDGHGQLMKLLIVAVKSLLHGFPVRMRILFLVFYGVAIRMKKISRKKWLIKFYI